MKKCPYCGFENPESAVRCATCDTVLTAEPPSDAPRSHVLSAEESRFWERMTFRQFALLFLRVQALWFFFYAALDLTFVARYLGGLSFDSRFSEFSADTRQTLFWDILRVVLDVAAALGLICYGERVLSWLVKDWVSKQQRPNADIGPNSA